MYRGFTLSDELTQLTVIPELGGAISSWQRKIDGLDLLRPMPLLTPDTTARQLGAFLLIPWSNRIAKGGVDTPMGWVDLPNTPNQEFALHGTTWSQAWEVVKASSCQITLTCTSLSPIAIQATQSITLNDGKLEIAVEVTHLDDRAFWHGYGWHPFFPRTPDTQLNTHLTRIWKKDAQGLSLYESDIPQDLDFSQIKSLPDYLVDHAFSGWDGHYTLYQPDLGYQIEVSATHMDYLLLYTPEHHEFFCAEPISHPINAHHLPMKPGLRLLEKSDIFTFNLSLDYSAR